jgi:predicted nuclease of restriction endonuclease-like (RecB) superfamily
MRRFFLPYPRSAISQTLSGKSGSALPVGKSQTVSENLGLAELAQFFALPWSAYARLLVVKDEHARRFYEAEALRGGWSVRQLDRQINSQFYERTALSKNKAAMLVKGAAPMPEDAVTPDDAIKDPYVLEFLDLKDGYSESDLEQALIQRLEDFLLELGDGFTFVGRQRRLRIDHALEGLPNKVMAANYKMMLPDAELLQKELENTQRLIESRGTRLPRNRKK